MDNTDHDELLRILQAHGQQFLNSFSLPCGDQSLRKRKRLTEPETSTHGDANSIKGEWMGINANHNQDLDEVAGFSNSDSKNDDDNINSGCPASTRPVTVFSDSVSISGEKTAESKAQMKAFMSSKVTKFRSEPSISNRLKPTATDEELEEERTNAQNDALLHKLVHTKLLSGSLDPNLDLTPSQRRKAFAGRVLELSGVAKLGKGETTIRKRERIKASKNIREGIAAKQTQRHTRDLEEAKNLGNYHPTLKKVFEASSPSSSRKRERGLKMGVGTFKGGSLRLSQEDINMADPRSSFGIGARGRGRGGHHGTRGKRR